ncbi:phosphotransferase [Paenibacillus sp. MMS20-IR301]|uniref:phosphotransferase family protein n=1 Tax=Paenibacillus sp. MMS20-IR301 TaxID=2895946 RepID=UPI0028E27E0C|nr:phosphotransferase [Paenibacillus sp. MMS20-IR301]WNS43850.1 phosphotransferase [Paenibacillus sp. MMS20-IR301]
MQTAAGKLAERIAGAFLKEQVQASYQITGKGFVNQVYVVETTNHKVVVRMNDADHFPGYVKENWCISQAAAAGIPGPEVLSIGIAEETAYMIQEFVEGDNGQDSTVSKSAIWRQLGGYSRLIHSIPVKGYGEHLIDPLHGEFHSPAHPGSDGSWQGYVQYNINSLTADDRLIELGVTDQAKSQRVRKMFEQVRQKSFRFGLIHGDLSLKNTIIDPAGQVILLDWGNAEVRPVPYGEIIALMQSQLASGEPAIEDFNAYLDGYGLSAGELTDIHPLLLLKAFDNLRWALDQRPDLIDAYAASAKQAVGIVMG